MREEVIFEVWRAEARILLSLCHCTGTTNFANFADLAADFATFPKI